MLKTVVLSGVVWLTTIAPTAPPAPISPPTLETDATCTPAVKCCEVCDKGQACGNSCISRSKTCHKGRGCSCNATEVCGR